MATPTPTSGAVLTAEDRLDIDAALANFAAGIDENDPVTLGAVSPRQRRGSSGHACLG